MLILCSISSGSKFLSVSHTSSYESLGLNVVKNIKSLCEVSNNWQNDLLRTSV